MGKSKDYTYTKQVIVVRKDIKLDLQSLASTVAHASLKVFLDNSEDTTKEGSDFFSLNVKLPSFVKKWVERDNTKVVLEVDTLEDLMLLYNKMNFNTPYALVEETNKNLFKEPTVTCLAVGPGNNQTIDNLTLEYRPLEEIPSGSYSGDLVRYSFEEYSRLLGIKKVDERLLRLSALQFMRNTPKHLRDNKIIVLEAGKNNLIINKVFVTPHSVLIDLLDEVPKGVTPYFMILKKFLPTPVYGRKLL